ncbi:MAG: hypothetical protein JWO36_4333 [Myxococcales bacterium]|nr:hypothetical protein [Myxococcales bacterium]
MRILLLCLVLGACGAKKASPPLAAVPPPKAECDPKQCGPRLGLATQQCADGSTGGNTGRCLHHPDNTCGWEIRECPRVTSDCIKTGCSAAICADPGNDVVSTCEMKPEYACYRNAACERQPNGHCGWTPSVGLTKCLASPPPLKATQPPQ